KRGIPPAYNPAGTPRPFPLNGTIWQPPIKYNSGAEVIRWTLDANNDNAINSSDVAATDAIRTKNPNDFMLVREVYGDSSAATLGNNGGSQSQVALVRKPGGGIPALFTVYFRGLTTPWSWANGPVPPSLLNQIERITINVRATSAVP